MLVELVILATLWSIPLPWSLAMTMPKNLKRVREDELCAIPQVRYIDSSQEQTGETLNHQTHFRSEHNPNEHVAKEHCLQRSENSNEELALAKAQKEYKTQLWFKYFNRHPLPKQPFTREQRLNMRKEWEKNKADLILLHNDSKELLEHFTMFEISTIRPENSYQERLENAIAFFERSKKMLSMFKQWRLFDLGGISTPHSDFEHFAALLQEQKDNELENWLKPLPSDSLFKIAKTTKRKSALSFVEEIKNFINSSEIDYRELESESKWPVLEENSCVYAFKIIDFLFKNGFISKADVHEFLRDDETRKKAIFSGLRNLYMKIQYPILLINQSTSKDWFWPFGFEFFRFINQDEIETLILEYKTKYIFNHVYKNINNYPYGMWRAIVESLLSNKYVKKLEIMHKSSHFKSNRKFQDEQSLAIQDYKEFREDVKNLINLLGMVIDSVKDQNIEKIGENVLILTICDLLDLVNTKLVPGIMSKISEENGIKNQCSEDLIYLTSKYSRFLSSFKAAKKLKDYDNRTKQLLNNQLVEIGFFWKYYSDILQKLHSEFIKNHPKIIARNDEHFSQILEDQFPIVSSSNLREKLLKFKPEDLPSNVILPYHFQPGEFRMNFSNHNSVS